ncbi:uncharacterized protein TRAVEDRAFT_150499 [Trametes versicolor FP-101664 SS1]|uniref:uncharacterized protein n=1 Tax=Trametes versicolor (strain FP-101664) TaxID=717944 RepID=UPI0004623ACC|nr:uncharacterized protein TRAVEDRAFT_150499 [Trametes versicolor FP-101664 SS1]EIW57849.1 hypothetical protein TRAVEDRAFT_150499 [Trametes versicolor FP-101664 SS1]
MASAATPLAERAEVHKSCKTLESVVNILNDYCEAANAIVQLQKKLAKALREAASPKCVSEIPANALNASATIFEAMAEVDAKFAKYADKECDTVSGEVKKWFKKLAKEERLHDEKIASANQRIKQAGQVYERKAKKNPRDAAEEHTRYINLLSTLGPEVNREKYNHALLVTQKHSATMYNLASGFSRVADAEWGRSCESVRRFSPTVGPLGQWKALCEGGWSGAMPPDLPDINGAREESEVPSSPSGTNDHESGQFEEPARDLAPPSLDKPAPQYSSRNASEQESTSRAVTPGQSPVPPPQYFPPTPAGDQASADDRSFQGSTKETEDRTSVADTEERKGHSTTLASLAAFPSPPTHFPLPPLGGSKFTPVQETHSELSQGSQGSSGLAPFPRLTESPTPESVSTPALTDDSRSPPTPRTELFTPPPFATSQPSAGAPSHDKNSRDFPAHNSSQSQAPYAQATPTSSQSSSVPHHQEPPQAERGLPALSESPTNQTSPTSGAYRRGDYADDAEFGVRRSADVSRPRAAEPSLTRVVERSDTGKSQGSVVAALRDRYARTGGPSSPPPRELPRLPTSVSSLAHRYEPTAGAPSLTRQATGSPTQERTRTSVDNYSRMPEPTSGTRDSTRYQSVPPTPTSDEIAMRRQRIEELEELELRERDLELRMKEREIDQRARELERERQQLLNVRGTRNDGYVSDGSRATSGPRISTTQRPSIDTRYSSSYSQSSTNLVPPSQGMSSRQPSSQPSSPNLQPPSDHAPYCGCESCSASKYKTRDHLPRRDSRPTEPPLALRPEKPRGGWIRRLSMPVVSNAFSLDSKKNASNVGIAGGPGYRNSLAFDEEGRLQTDVTGGIRNRSSTNVARR